MVNYIIYLFVIGILLLISHIIELQASIVVVGVGLAVAGFAGRQALRVAPQVAQRMSEILKTMSSESGLLVNYTIF